MIPKTHCGDETVIDSCLCQFVLIIKTSLEKDPSSGIQEGKGDFLLNRLSQDTLLVYIYAVQSVWHAG